MSVLINYDGIVRQRFVETGTFEGTSLSHAAKHFKECFSCEVDTEISTNVARKFAGVPNVSIFNLESSNFLRFILDHRIPTTFWLDAHYDGKDLPHGVCECSLLGELFEIVRLNWVTPPLILIDDADMFLGDGIFDRHPGHWKRTDWPSILQIDEMLSGFVRSLRGESVLMYSKD